MNRLTISGVLHNPPKATTTHQNMAVALAVLWFDEKNDGRITIFASGQTAIELGKVAVEVQITVEGRLVRSPASQELEMSVDRIKDRRRNENEEIVEETHSHSLHSGFSRTRPPSR